MFPSVNPLQSVTSVYRPPTYYPISQHTHNILSFHNRLSPMSSDFDSPNFDPIHYLNTRFPTQESLANLDGQISKLTEELGDINKELLTQIHDHAMLNIEIGQEIKKAKTLSKEIISEIGIIKQKAKKSQQIVYDMCKDLKSLDIAKKNLTFSIDALKKFIMMFDALEKLRQACRNQQYNDVANLISAFTQLSNHFKKYEDIPQIQQLYTQKTDLIEQLYEQLTEDFEAYYNATSTQTSDNMAAACQVVATLGDKFWRKFCQKLNQIVLKDYEQQFGASENAVLENTERRFNFAKRRMQQFNKRFQNVLPLSWGMDCLLMYQFCSITRVHLAQVLASSAQGVNVAVLMKSLEVSMKFQQKITEMMLGKYGESMKKDKKERCDLKSLPKFKGSISNSFEPYLKPYIKSQEQVLLQAVMKAIADDRLTQIKAYNSSLVLFHGIRNCVRRASGYSKGNLLLQMLTVVKRVLRLYSQRCFQRSKKAGDLFEEGVCWMINTAQFCKKMIDEVQELFETSIDPAFADGLTFSDENELFSKQKNAF